MSLILKLDAHGYPNKWISKEDAVTYHAKGLVAWSLGGDDTVFRGGVNRLTGELSIIKTSSIIAVKGEYSGRTKFRAPSLSNKELFRRDHYICAYCGHTFRDHQLTRDHIIPRSRGGLDTWTNVVTACKHCNNKKDDRTLAEANLQLLYVPYVPSKAEHLILSNRSILADQMNFLISFVHENSRVHQYLKEYNV